MKRILLIAVGILLLISVFSVRGLIKERAERKRYEANTNALMNDLSVFRTAEGKWAAEVQALQLKTSEIERFYADEVKRNEDLGIKLRRIESMAAAGTKTDISIQAPIRDTLIRRDTVGVLAGAVSWRDPWTDFRGVIEGGELVADISIRDTLRQTVYREPRTFLFFRWGTKSLRQIIVSSNPHTTFEYNEYIKVVK